MLTRSGWFVALLGALTLVAARLLGLIELYVIGATIVAIIILALLFVRLTRLRLEIAREVHPLRVYAGQVTRVEVRATNRGRTRTPLLIVNDPVVGTKGANLNLAPLAHSETARAAYRLPTASRGLVGVGPLTVRLADPFGLASLTVVAAPLVELIVLPRIDELRPANGSGGRDPHAGTDNPTTLGRQGEDFHSLRPYVMGDDLRRVHWASSARADDLMVRTDEIPWQGRTTVVLDTRRGMHTDISFEFAVSAAASLMHAAWGQRDAVRLLTTDGVDLSTSKEADGLVDHLATIQTSTRGGIRSVLGRLRASGPGGALVVVLGRATTTDLDALATLGRSFGIVTVVITAADALVGQRSRRGLRIVQMRPDRAFAELWSDVHGQPRSTRITI